MTQDSDLQERGLSLGALLFASLPLLIPIAGTLAIPARFVEPAALLWFAAVFPALTLGYARGWRGIAASVALSLGATIATEIVARTLGRPIPPILGWVIVAYLAIAVGVGWVTALLSREREDIKSLALTDNLTRLPNRRHGRVFLENEFAAAKRGRPLSVVLFDLDRFKSFNDVHGHRAGDQALKRFGELLSSTTRRMDLSSRFGGEEFLTVLPGSDRQGALLFAERVREAVEGVRLPQGNLTVSAGVAEYQPSMRSPDELIAAADLALYRAKRDGRNCVRVFGKAHEPEAGVSGGEGSAGAAASIDPRTEEAHPRANEETGRSPSTRSLLSHVQTAFGDGRTVCLVEEEGRERTSLAGYLLEQGFAVIGAHGGEEPPALPDRDVDVVIAGARAGEPLDGNWIRGLKSRWPAVQVILLFDGEGADPARKTQNLSADYHLTRPLDLSALKGHLIDALARRDHLKAEAPGAARTPDGSVSPEDARAAILEGAHSLVRAVEIRDAHKLGHAARVAAYAETILRAAQIDPSTIDPDSLRLACELHDIGEIGVPQDILNKEGPLTPEELQLIQQHPRIGSGILESLLANEIVLAATRSHHERWDGSGYPDGLAGEEIPLAARIVGLAEALDGMTSPRAYRVAFPWDSAVDQILALGGSQFDPELVEAFRMASSELESVHAAQQ